MQQTIKLKDCQNSTLNFEKDKERLIISVRDKDGLASHVFSVKGEEFVAKLDELVQDGEHARN